MGKVAKYNVYKGLSTALTVGTPIVTLASCSDFFVHKSSTSVSAAGVFAILLSLLLFKDRILENFKLPSAFVISVVSLILLIMVESILLPLKYVCIATICTSGIDELTFKRFYKNIEYDFIDEYKRYKHFGFLFTTSEKVRR